ncbi:hypothetical protein DPX16_8630 [Anabarilius grahami]|uniref:Uncharacterized protein n=1 Tax=Anabarilius grahami TaxID=495550 RepID=A0A3N0Z105_ANAGA|nr:hypothetical protein DPX16_8630 [Anabarilius grahami]
MRNFFLLIYDPFPQSASPVKQKFLNLYAPSTILNQQSFFSLALFCPLHFCPSLMDSIRGVCLWSTLNITILSQCTAFSQTHCSLKSLHMEFTHSQTISNTLKGRQGERPKAPVLCIWAALIRRAFDHRLLVCECSLGQGLADNGHPAVIFTLWVPWCSVPGPTSPQRTGHSTGSN